MTEFSALFQTIREGGSPEELDEQFPFYPLDAPGMPLPGPDFIQAAVELGDGMPTMEGSGTNKHIVDPGVNLHYLYRRALYDNAFRLPVKVKGRMVSAAFLPGHRLGELAVNMQGGPIDSRIMIIGKSPGKEEMIQSTHLVGLSSPLFYIALEQLGVYQSDYSTWYVTALCKWPQLDQQGDTPLRE